MVVTLTVIYGKSLFVSEINEVPVKLNKVPYTVRNINKM